jgi:hypothetical protein
MVSMMNVNGLSPAVLAGFYSGIPARLGRGAEKNRTTSAARNYPLATLRQRKEIKVSTRPWFLV